MIRHTFRLLSTISDVFFPRFDTFYTKNTFGAAENTKRQRQLAPAIIAGGSCGAPHLSLNEKNNFSLRDA